MRFTLPLAIRLIEDDILIECEFYEGDLLKAVLQVSPEYYQNNATEFIKVASIVSLKDNRRIMSEYDGNRELRRLFENWSDYRQSYWLRIITKDYAQPIDGVKEFLYRTISDDVSADVEFGDYTEYWKWPEQGTLLTMLTTVIPFDILRNRIAQQWHPADRIGNSFVADCRTMGINHNQIDWICITLED